MAWKNCYQFWDKNVNQIRAYSDSVRVRFAPSPTGFIHLGGLRTAFYNYLFAKKHNGKFILRVEDTDQVGCNVMPFYFNNLVQERIVPGSLDNIIDTLRWSQIMPDEGPSLGGKYGPYIQSQRMDIYRAIIDQLSETKSIYKCFCTHKRLDLLRREAAKNRETIKYDNRCRSLSPNEIKQNLLENKSYTIRLKLKEGPIVVNDMVYGPVTYDLSKIEGDPILIKSDGLPTYHFASVVDDHFMEISHVLRGVEWLVSTPKHLMLYEALGWTPPRYAHLPIIINKDGTKLSKRHDHIRISTYQEKGYYPETVNNYLTQMGGGFGNLDTANTNKVYSLDQLTEAFNIEKVNQNNCKIDVEKMKLLNRICMKDIFHYDKKRLVQDLKALFSVKFSDSNNLINFDSNDNDYILKVIEWSLERIFSLEDLFSEQFTFIWIKPTYTWNVTTFGSNNLIVSCLQATIDKLNEIPVSDFEDTEQILSSIRALHLKHFQGEGMKFGTYMKLLRFSLTNLKVGSPVGETMWLLGRKRTIEYLLNAINYVNNSFSEQNHVQKNSN